jgi:hypothetical protein
MPPGEVSRVQAGGTEACLALPLLCCPGGCAMAVTGCRSVDGESPLTSEGGSELHSGSGMTMMVLTMPSPCQALPRQRGAHAWGVQSRGSCWRLEH